MIFPSVPSESASASVVGRGTIQRLFLAEFKPNDFHVSGMNMHIYGTMLGKTLSAIHDEGGMAQYCNSQDIGQSPRGAMPSYLLIGIPTAPAKRA